MRRNLHFFTMLLATVLITSSAFAATVTWTGKGATNNWSDAGNWDTGYVPGVAPHTKDDVILPPLKAPGGADMDYTVNMDVDTVNGVVTIGGATGGKVTLRTNGRLFIAKKLNILATGTHDDTASGNMTIEESANVRGALKTGPASVLNMPAGSLGITVNEGGKMTLGGGIGDSFIHGGSLTNNGSVTQDGSVGQFRIYADQDFDFINNGLFTMIGNCCLHPGTTLPVPTLHNGPGGLFIINATGNYDTIGFFFINEGIMHLAGGNIDCETGGEWGGTFQLDSGTSWYPLEGEFEMNGLTCNGPGYLGNFGGTIDCVGNNFVQFAGQYSGQLNVEAGATLQSPNPINIYGGIAAGLGTVSGNLFLSGSAAGQPGYSPGIFSINGNYSQTSGTSLNIELAGNTPGFGHDQLNISGTAALAGTLNISQIDGFTSNGGSYVIMRYASRTGTFATVNGLNLGNGRTLQLQYNATNITLIDPGPPVPTYTVSGRVTLNGAGLANVAIKRSNTNTTELTDASGNFSFSGVPTGSYTLVPTLLGYNFTPSARNVAVGSANVLNQNFTAAIAVFTIKGRISNTSGTAMPNILVSRTSASSVSTDANGYYTFSNVHVGTYTIAPVPTASLVGVSFTPASYIANVTTANLSNLNFIAQFTITGKVSNSNGAGIPNLLVTRTQGGSAVTVTTDAGGNYKFSNVRSGTYTIAPQIPPSQIGMTFNPSSYSATVTTSNLTNRNFTAFFTVSGKVTTSTNVAMPNVLMRLATPTSSTTVLTDATGNYKFAGVRSGSYTLTPTQSGKTFAPTSRSVAVSTANVGSLTFIGS